MAPPTDSPDKPADTTHFGYKDVPVDDKADLVKGVFDSVASRYDLMNDLMSGGLHRLWKDDFVTQLGPPKSDRPFRLLDVAGGTGDVALRFVKRGGAGCRAVICDISPEMLEVGQRRVNDQGLAERIELIEGNAEATGLAEASFDFAISEYGERYGYGSAVATVLFMIMLVYISYFLWRMYQDERGGR